MRPGPVPLPEQQALAMLFRPRDLLPVRKTRLEHALRAHLAKHAGVVAGVRRGRGCRSIVPLIKPVADRTTALPQGALKNGSQRVAATSRPPALDQCSRSAS